jgi:hypothetical protein
VVQPLRIPPQFRALLVATQFPKSNYSEAEFILFQLEPWQQRQIEIQSMSTITSTDYLDSIRLILITSYISFASLNPIINMQHAELATMRRLQTMVHQRTPLFTGESPEKLPKNVIVGQEKKSHPNPFEEVIGLYGETWLLVSCLHGFRQAVHLLHGQGCNLNRSDAWGRTPLCLTAATRHRTMLQTIHKIPTASDTSLVHMHMLPDHPPARSNIPADGTTAPNQVQLEHLYQQQAQLMDPPPQTPSLQTSVEAVEMVRLLCHLGADLDLADIGGRTPVYMAAHDNALMVVATLAANGADLAAEDVDGFTPLAVAKELGNDEVVTFLQLITLPTVWSPLRIAIGCRFLKDAALALKTGRFAAPEVFGVEEMMVIRNTAARGSPGLARKKTLQFALAATSGWAPSRHFLHHLAVRNAVRTVLLCAERLENDGQEMMPHLSHVPPELWLCVLGFFLRSDWTVLG